MQKKKQPTNNIKTILFDFDGTLCDSFSVFTKAFKVVAEEFNLNHSVFESDTLRDLSTHEILKNLGVSLWQLPKITKRGREEMFKLKDELSLFEGTEALLAQLYKDKIKVGILTSNSSELVESLIPGYLLKNIDLLKPSPMFGKSKAINSYLKQNNLNKDEVAYVGDETRDIDAANRSKVFSVAVSYGYNSANALSASTPKQVFHKIQDILTLY